MAGKSRRSKLVLSDEDRAELEQLSRSRTLPHREAQRAAIILGYHGGESIASIGSRLGMTRLSVSKWVAKALAVGPMAALKDTYRRPGVQAIGNTAPDLPPVPGKHPTISRDHEYKRLCACSILAALDLQDGHVTARVEDRHRSVEFIGLLSDLDAKYPPECTIRIILDNHSAHISKETHALLSRHPNRFQYVLTPKHGSWLNIVETLFGKMARSFLRHIRGQSLNELKARILKGIAEINAAPVVHRWKNFKTLESGIIRLYFTETSY